MFKERIVQKATESSGFFREATLRFVADPQIHAEICSVINDAFYDYLHEEGFLDLPPDWRALGRVAAYCTIGFENATGRVTSSCVRPRARSGGMAANGREAMTASSAAASRSA